MVKSVDGAAAEVGRDGKARGGKGVPLYDSRWCKNTGTADVNPYPVRTLYANNTLTRLTGNQSAPLEVSQLSFLEEGIDVFEQDHLCHHS